MAILKDDVVRSILADSPSTETFYCLNNRDHSKSTVLC